MKTVGVYEAKTHFSRLLEEVKRGQKITITRHGKPVATIEAVEEERKMSLAEIRDAFRELRKSLPRGGPSIRELIDEGRKY